MISFNKEKNLFHLTNNSISLYIYINSCKHLETIYFGKHLEIDNIDSIRRATPDNWSTQYFDKVENKEYTFDDGYQSRMARIEVPTHGLQDHRPAPLIIRKPNGNYETNFMYISHRLYKGLPTYKKGPQAHGDNAFTIEFTLKDEFYDIYLKYNISIFDDKDIILKNFEILNEGQEEVHILKAMSISLDLPSCNYNLHHFQGKWARERNEVVTPIADGIYEISSNYGRSSHEENPFVFLSENDANNEYGESIGFNLIYSGNFKTQVSVDYLMGTRIVYGLNDIDFDWVLKPKNGFTTPQAVISYSYTGIDKMSQNFHAFIKENLITYRKDRKYKEVLFNSWEGTEMNFTTESMFSYVDGSLKIGAELFVLDDGWFGKRNTEYSALGDWYVNTDKIDLKKLINYVHDKGMKFGLWFEPEMISADSDLYRSHPEYALGNHRRYPTIHRHQFALDLSNPNVVDNIYNQMIKILDEYPVDYIKWDHNRDIKEHFSLYHGHKHQGEIYHRIILGYYDLIERLVKRYPNIMFEGCASGGGRFDLGTLYYAPQIWASDESNPAERMYIQYNTSIGYPLSTIGSHVNNHKITSYKTKAILALFGTYGYEMDPNKLTETEIQEINEVKEIYQKYHHDVIAEGKLYHLYSPHNSNYMSMQSVSLDLKKSLVIFMNRRKEHGQNRYLKLKGLDDSKTYHINYDNSFRSGKELMYIGINLSNEFLHEFTCRLIIIEEV